jgi:hypothetical protein
MFDLFALFGPILPVVSITGRINVRQPVAAQMRQHRHSH